MRDKYTDAIRVGKVSSIDPVNCTAQVTFEDRGGIVSGDLPIIVPFTLGDKFYYMPAVEERVWVLFEPEAPSKGCILGSYYADNRPPPVGDRNKVCMKFEDGTLLEYDKGQHKLTVHVLAGTVEISAGADIAVAAPNITLSGEVKITGKTTISGDTDITGAATITGTTTISGDITHTGNMTTSGTHTDSIGGHCAC